MAPTTSRASTQTVSLPSDQDASGRTLGDEEIKLLAEAIDSGTLTSTKGKFVREFQDRFAGMLGVAAAYGASHGTAAIHAAIAAIDPEPGDEIITSPITDMEALTPILYQAAIPVFCDVDPKSCNVTAQTIAAALSNKTRAIMVTHLFGCPCDLDPIMALAQKHKLPVIEDCSQAFGATYQGRFVGTFGDIGCFSLQQGKHITTGEGGVAVTNHPDLARRMFLFINKAWGYGDAKPDHYFLALNYRMNELSGAVASAQLGKLADSVSRRVEMADRLSERLRDLPGILVPTSPAEGVHSYWKYCLNVDPNVVSGGAVGLAKVLREEFQIASAPRYIQKPAFECEIFASRRTFGNSQFPFTLARPEAVNYPRERFPGVYRGLAEILVLPWNERYARNHVDYIANAVQVGLRKLSSDARETDDG